MDTDVEERRRSERVAPSASSWDQVRLRTGHEVRLVNVSGEGALIETSARLLPGTAIMLHVSSDEGAMAVRARVIRCHVCAITRDGAVRYRGAVAFDSRDPRDPG